MAEARLQVVPMSDRQVISVLEQIGATAEEGASVMISWELLGVMQEEQQFETRIESKTFSAILNQDGAVLSRAWITFSEVSPQASLTVEFQQIQRIPQQQPYSQPPPDISAFVIRTNGAFETNPSRMRGVLLLVADLVAPYKRADLLKTFLPQVDHLNEQREVSLRRLENLADRILVQADEDRRAAKDRLNEEEEGLRNGYAAERQKLQSEFDQKTEALKQRAAELDSRAKELDDRGNTHVRREIYRDLKKQLQVNIQKFALTPETQSKRTPIQAAFAVMTVVLLASLAWASWISTHVDLAHIQNVFLWLLVLRFSLSLAALVGTVLYYIRWQDRWSQSHADEELSLKRTSLDIDRASWLVEVSLEWQREKGTEMPPEMLNKLGAGLFEASNSRPTLTHPMEDVLAAILSSSSSIKVNMPQGEVNLDRKGLKEAEKKVEKTDPK